MSERKWYEPNADTDGQIAEWHGCENEGDWHELSDELWRILKRTRSELAAMTKRAEEAEAVVAKLPKTADGVIAVPGTRLYPLYPVLPEDGHPDFDDVARLEYCITDPLSGEFLREYDGLLIDTCYSTREAAETALAARERGEG